MADKFRALMRMQEDIDDRARLDWLDTYGLSLEYIDTRGDHATTEAVSEDQSFRKLVDREMDGSEAELPERDEP